MRSKIVIQTTFILVTSAATAICQKQSFDVNSFSQCKDRYYDLELKRTIIYNAEVKPMFPGGPSGYMRYLNKEFCYPKTEDLNTAQTSTMADFIVDTDGAILKPKIVRNSTGDTLSSFEQEFLRVLTKMPKWEPGRCFNKKVAVIVRLPIRVELDDEYEQSLP